MRHPRYYEQHTYKPLSPITEILDEEEFPHLPQAEAPHNMTAFTATLYTIPTDDPPSPEHPISQLPGQTRQVPLHHRRVNYHRRSPCYLCPLAIPMLLHHRIHQDRHLNQDCQGPIRSGGPVVLPDTISPICSSPTVCAGPHRDSNQGKAPSDPRSDQLAGGNMMTESQKVKPTTNATHSDPSCTLPEGAQPPVHPPVGANASVIPTPIPSSPFNSPPPPLISPLPQPFTHADTTYRRKDRIDGTHPHIPTVIVFFGLNNREQDVHLTTLKQIRSIFRLAKTVFPGATFYFPHIQYSSSLPLTHQYNLDIINNTRFTDAKHLAGISDDIFTSRQDIIHCRAGPSMPSLVFPVRNHSCNIPEHCRNTFAASHPTCTLRSVSTLLLQDNECRSQGAHAIFGWQMFPKDLYKHRIQIQRAREMSPHVPVAQVDLQTFPIQEPINQSSHTRNSFPGHSRATDEETFKPRDRLDAAGLTEKRIQVLERYGLEYKSNLVGQAYDGASVMSGKHSGIQARIKESPTLDLCSAVDLVEALVKRFQDYRDETYFEGLWKEVLNTSAKCNVETDPIPKRKTKRSRMLDGHTVMSSV
ncbi:hypothetical protein JOQ06_028791, partial [Pogonophryne albipinna]